MRPAFPQVEFGQPGLSLIGFQETDLSASRALARLQSNADGIHHITSLSSVRLSHRAIRFVLTFRYLLLGECLIR